MGWGSVDDDGIDEPLSSERYTIPRSDVLSLASGGASAVSESPQLDFQIQVDGNRCSLVLGDRTFFGFLQVERLELLLRDLRFPLQITGGIEQLNRDATSIQRASLTITQHGIDELLARRKQALTEAGFHGVQARIADGYVVVEAEVHANDLVADFSCRIASCPAIGGVRLVINDSNLFGWINRPAPLVLHELFSTLLGMPAALRTAEGGVALAIALSMGALVTHPIEQFITRTFPSAKWRLPSNADSEVTSITCQLGAITVEYGPRAEAGAVVAIGPRVDHYLRHQEAATALLAGHLEQAAIAYQRLGYDNPDQTVFSTRRVLELWSAERSTVNRAAKLATASIDRWPTFLPGHLTLAATTIASGHPDLAALHFDRVGHIAEHAGHQEAAVRSALAGARVTRQVNPDRAARFYRRVLRCRPGDPTATAALAELGFW